MTTMVTEAEERRYAELQRMALDFARDGETAELAEMARHGLPLNLCDARGNSLLMLAAYHGHLETARMLLESGAEVDRRNDRGQTPLGGVAFKGYADLVALLLEHGADINADNGMGMTPVMFAAVFGRHRVVAQLKEWAEAREEGDTLRHGLLSKRIVSLTGWLRAALGRSTKT